MSAAVEFTAAADIELAVGDQQVSLSAGQSWSITATGATTVEIPGVLTARVTPGATDTRYPSEIRRGTRRTGCGVEGR